MIIKFKNHIVVLLTMIISLCLMCGVSVSADDYSAIICDDCDVLTNEEENELTQYLYDKSQEACVNIAVVISDETDRNGAMDYADVYEENLFGINSDSILYLINMNDGYDWLSCSGLAIDYYPQDTIDYILQNTSGKYLMDENSLDFYGAIEEYGYLVVSQQDLPTPKPIKFMLSFVVGLIVSIIVCCIIASKYKFHASTSATTYAKSANGGNVTFTQRRDNFIRTYTTKTARSENNSNTSTHTSSGGGTHSGGGFQR